MYVTERKYSAVEAKQSFGQVIDAAQHSPVTITKHNRDIAVIVSAEKIRNLSQFILSDYFRELVNDGSMTFFEALDRQTEIENKASYALDQHKRGETKPADDTFFDNIKKQALERAN